MSSDPERSVVDADHRTWEVPNLFIADGSVMPTQGSANPALTIELGRAGVGIHALVPEGASLEELFFELTEQRQ